MGFQRRWLARFAYLFALGFLWWIAANEVAAEQHTARDSEKLNSYLKKGQQALQQQNCEQAIESFNHAIQIDPDNALGLESRGCAFLLKGSYDAAITDFDKALQLNSTNSNLYFNRGGAHRVKGEIDQAIGDFTKCLQLNKTNDLAYKTRAACFSAKGEFKKEIEDWNKGLELAPNDAVALGMRGYAYYMTKDFGKAVEDYKKALSAGATKKVYNHFAWLRATCPEALFRNGREVVELATKACEGNDDTKWIYIDTLAAAYAESEDFEKAVLSEQTAMSLKEVTTEDLKEMESRLLLYKSNKPYREKPTLEQHFRSMQVAQ